MKKLLYISLFFINAIMGMDNSNIRFASNDNDFRNYAILVSEQEATPRPKIENTYMKAMEDELKKASLDYLNSQEKAKNNPKLTEKDMRFIDRALTEMTNCSRRHSHLDDKKVQSICKPNYPNKTFNDYLMGITKIFKICQKKVSHKKYENTKRV